MSAARPPQPRTGRPDRTGPAGPAPLFHDDDLTAHLHCAEVEWTGLRAGDVVWVPSPDAFNPRRELVEVVDVAPTGWARVAPVGGDDRRGPVELRWFAPTGRFFLARTVNEAALANGGR